ncbi:MAG: pentapeptide repeat-containing protein, partial [Oscillospiraceae bacterium]|nr:pentapeptide repeat-containing protein [Oscillospiraceae bacterium]
MAKKSKTYERLRSLGYDRAENSENQVQHKTLRAENYASMMLNHMIMDHVTMENCDFTEACATGSIFRHCKFKNCELNQSDFEFCEFYNCEFESKTPILCSFNNSSFSNTDFHNIIFRNCTLTGALFTRCCWDGGKIWNSTLEGAKFRQCTFLKIDFRGLNMDYIELEKPYMDNVVLPLDQIPFMFGCLKYLRVTTDTVKISKG